MNEALKDVSLFTNYAEVDVLVESGELVYLDDTDTGKAIDEKMKEICSWIPHNFAHDEDPLWPKHGNTFVSDLFEARHLGEDEFMLVWRDMAFTYYKRFGRSTCVTRALTDEEATQFINELRGTLQALAAKNPYDPLARYRPAEEPLPKDPAERTKAVAARRAAEAKIAELDAREGYYSVDERRVMMAKKKNYTPVLKPIPTLERLNDILEVLNDEEIPEKK